MKKLAFCLLLLALLIPRISVSEDSYDIQLNKGIRNSLEYSYALIQQSTDRRADAVALLKKAQIYSPDLPAVYFALSRAGFSFSGAGILDSVNYIVQGINAYSRNFWWSFTLSGSLFFSLILSFILSMIIIVSIRLIADMALFAHDLRENAFYIFFLLALVMFSIISPLFFIAGLLILLGLYMKKSDRITVYLFLLFLIFSPMVFKAVSIFINTSSSGTIKAIIQANEGSSNDYALSVLKNRDDFISSFSYALALKRSGHYNEAITVYKKLAEKRPAAKVYVNLGNCYVGLYNFLEEKRFNLEEAAKYYVLALNTKPVVSAYYNLSQVSREMLDFPKGEEYFKYALDQDRVAVSSYSLLSGRNPNRLVADETLVTADLWEYAVGADTTATTFGFSLIPATFIPVLALALLISFYLLTTRLKQKAYRCRKCNDILCPKCEKRIMWGQMCPQCYRSLIKLDELDVKERVARLLSIYEKQRKRRNAMKILSFILPGSSQIFAGKILLGFFFLWPFLFFILVPVTNLFFSMRSSLVSHSFFNWAALFMAIMLYFATNLITRQRISKGWL
ncbi:MAG: hypothetical protein HZA17_12680 [Nitrospirae bacterium]|nr:hypothetical protein [Nitrospirota bacterium]